MGIFRLTIHEKFNKLAPLYIESELDEKAAKEFEAHLAVCRECREKLLEYKRIIKGLRNIAVEMPSEEEWTDFQRSLRLRVTERKRKLGWLTGFAPLKWGTAGFALLFLVILAVIFIPREQTSLDLASGIFQAQPGLISEPTAVIWTLSDELDEQSTTELLWSEIEPQYLYSLFETVDETSEFPEGEDMVFSYIPENEVLQAIMEVL